MKYLLIGRDGVLSGALARKLSREQHRVYALTGSSIVTKKQDGVFERFDFPLDSDSVPAVIAGIRPDVAVFLGAEDPGFVWTADGASRQIRRFSTGVINVTLALQSVRPRRVILLSSGEAEAAATPKGAALATAEAFLLSRCEKVGMDPVILRTDGVLLCPKRSSEPQDAVVRMCLSASRDGEVSYCPGAQIAGLYLSDAAELVYRVSIAGAHTKKVYQAGGAPCAASAAAARVAAVFGCRVREGEQTADDSVPLSCDDLSEFGFSVRHTVESAAEMVAASAKTRVSGKAFREAAEAPDTDSTVKQLFRRAVPYLENLLVGVAAIVVSYLLYRSDTLYLSKLDLYLLYVLLFAVVYGRQQATIAAMIGVFGYFLVQSGDRTVFSLFIDFNTYVWIAQLFIVGLAAGYIKDTIQFRRQEADEEISYLRGQLTDLERIYGSVVTIKDEMETRLLNYGGSLGSLHETLEILNSLEEGQIMFRAVPAIADLMGTDEVAIYRAVDNRYCRLFSTSSKTARAFGKRIRYDQDAEMAACFRERRVFLNRGLSKDLPMMAVAVYHEDEINTIIMIWNMPLQSITQYQMNMLSVLGSIVGDAINRAGVYRAAVRDKLLLPGMDVLRPDAFADLIRIYDEAMEAKLAVYTLVAVDPTDAELPALAQCIRQTVRATDYLGMHDGELMVLLENTNAAEAAVVCGRLAEKGVRVSVWSGNV